MSLFTSDSGCRHPSWCLLFVSFLLSVLAFLLSLNQNKLNMNFFKIISVVTSLLFIYLFFQLIINSDAFVTGLGLHPSETVSILCRRTSIFMMGISVLMLSSINLQHSKARQSITLATGITMIGLACMGSFELIRGTVNTSMLTAIAIETILGTSFLILFFINRKAKISQS